ncbi:MAG: GAF domain-containing protein [Planctomycetales bacterium]|nr:GAF domain-containing protein [Planctomycetales bacterium]
MSDKDSAIASVVEQLRGAAEVVDVSSPVRALARLSRQPDEFDALYVAAAHFQEAFKLGRLLQNERILDGMPDGVAMLDVDNSILWANAKYREWCHKSEVVGLGFYQALGNPEILGPDFCPFHTALATGQPSISTLRSGDLYFQTHAAPVDEPDGQSQYLIVTVRDVSAEMLQQQKLAAIHKAGIELADLTPDEVFNMGVDERIELLKSNILHYTQDLLNFDVVEIRVKDEETGRLEQLLSYGIDEDAARRPLYASPSDNGVTGFVAATGKSYLCEDTTEDPLYLVGFQGAKSSLTVPLIFHDQVIGTFNVESPEPRAFTESDLQFLEIFSRDIAVALNTLELMVAQRASTAQESVEAIHGAVALPVDEILNDAVNVMERYIGHEPEVVQRLQRILKNARDIKQVIHEVGQSLAPAEAVPACPEMTKHAKLRGCRVLVVDADDSVRNDAHALLDRYGCNVETAHEGGEAVFMVRNCGPGVEYDVIIADIRLPDVNGYELLVNLKDILEPVPLVLMTGFGYDPGHSIVKARQAGLHPKAILYKPFRLDQLLETVECMLDVYGRVPQI